MVAFRRFAPLWISLLLVAGFALLTRAGSVFLDFRFQRAGELEGWEARNQIRQSTVEGGVLRILPAGRNPWLVLPRALPADDIDWLELRAKLTPGSDEAAAPWSNERVFHELTVQWLPAGATAYSEDAALYGELVLDGRYHTYRVPLGSHDLWRGQVSDLRLDLLDARAPYVEIEIDRITLLRHRITAMGSWQMMLVLLAAWAALAMLVGPHAGRVGRERPARRRLALGALVVLAPVTIVFATEAVLNLAGFSEPFSNDLVQVLFNEVEAPGMNRLFRYDPRCLFVLKPGARYRDDERIDAAGLRGATPSKRKAPGSLRVAVFGDSSTFGYGLPLEQTYARRLEQLLDGVAGRAEVINAGVIAYTVAQGWQLYDTRIRGFAPDVITLAFGAFNEQYPTVLTDLERMSYTRNIPRFVYESRRFLLDHLKTAQLVSRWMGQGRTVNPLDWSSYAMKRRVTPEEFTEVLTTFVELARSHGTEVVLISFPRRRAIEQRYPELLDYTARIEEVASARRVPLLDLRRRFLEIPDYEERYFLDGVHLNAEGNAVLAEELERVIARLPLSHR